MVTPSHGDDQNGAFRWRAKRRSRSPLLLWFGRSPVNVRDPFEENLRLRTETDQALLDFIRTDLGVCLTFATVVETAYSMGHREHAERTLAEAEKGYSDMLRYFLRARGMTPGVENELQSKFKHLRERLDGLQQRR